ncbi:MAG: transcriptional regulator [Chitinispirillaceae bacterium]|nr:transcriptional regulator [Chitinispirillaceae bacterium]
MSEKKSYTINPDKIIHERARLLILTYIASSDKNRISFNELQSAIEMTSGNLSVQIRKLEEVGYLSVVKEFKNKKPLTSVELTINGSEALRKYVEEMNSIIQSLSKKTYPE